MDLEEAKTLLSGAIRHELRDHAFGDTEVYWVLKGKEIATGYFGGGTADVSIISNSNTSFEGEDARALRNLGEMGDVARNDETGPDTYVEGQTMPGLTLEGVREELTGG